MNNNENRGKKTRFFVLLSVRTARRDTNFTRKLRAQLIDAERDRRSDERHTKIRHFLLLRAAQMRRWRRLLVIVGVLMQLQSAAHELRAAQRQQRRRWQRRRWRQVEAAAAEAKRRLDCCGRFETRKAAQDSAAAEASACDEVVFASCR